MPAKLIAGPTPDGGFISRRTDNDYSYAVATVATNPRLYKPRHKDADDFGHIPNPDYGKWVSLSWHGTRTLAEKKVQALNNRGVFDVVVVPVVDQ